MKIKDVIPDSLMRTIKGSKLYIDRLKRKGILRAYESVEAILDVAPPYIIDIPMLEKVKVGIVKDLNYYSDVEGYVFASASWLRYERFCKNNNIKYDFYDIYSSDWIEKAKDFDIIVWHTFSSPSVQYIAESKIYILEKILGKMCFPSFHEVWQYEDKYRANYLYQCLGIPSIPTVVTDSEDEALKIAERISYPFIYKNNIGAGSNGVLKVNDKNEAISLIRKSFGSGLKTYWNYFFNKDVFYFQHFVSDATYDLRIMMVGNMAFGYYRYPKKGDFRASGSGIYEKKEIPEEALKLAAGIKSKLNSRQMGVDLLFSEKENKYYVIETSLFNQIDTAEQLVVDGVSGYYDISDIDNIIFKPGKFWIQELTLGLMVRNYLEKK